MRYLRGSSVATALATVTGLALLGTAGAGLAQAAPAAPASLYPPSALVLTVGKGEDAATATVERAVTLNCSPRPSGTHPAPAAACKELAGVGGDLAQLSVMWGDSPCTRQWDPVTVTGDGVWQGRRVSWSATYANTCEMHAGMARNSVFAF
ncbi:MULTISPECIES: subtilase-type protease inhibitor [unclassified Streptomyces]|uniref:subtilase-type protease inhibitor n=1 Tax=unclassified Streptomyces TaxID=2593676 RepID=UPI0033A65450